MHSVIIEVDILDYPGKPKFSRKGLILATLRPWKHLGIGPVMYFDPHGKAMRSHVYKASVPHEPKFLLPAVLTQVRSHLGMHLQRVRVDGSQRWYCPRCGAWVATPATPCLCYKE